MKQLSLILISFVLFCSCKKASKEEVNPYFFNGNWSCEFNACEPVQDSSISIFSHVTDLSINYDSENYGLAEWAGCVFGNGKFRATQISVNKYQIQFTQTPGNVVYIPSLDYSIDWNSFVPNGSANYDLLNSAVVTVEKTSENTMLVTVSINNYPTQSYQWVKS